MANCCSVDLGINFNTQEDATAFYNWVKSPQEIADAEQRGLVLGKSDFAIIDDDVDMPSDHDVLIVGWVKWAVREPEFTEFVRMVVDTYDIACIKLNYEEFGCCLYGYYQYFPENGELCVFQVPQWYFDAYKGDPDLEENNPDKYIEDFEQYIYDCPEDEYECEVLAVIK